MALSGFWATSAITASTDPLYAVHDYSSDRNPEADLKVARTLARSGHKYILLEVGGTWCVWCKILETYIDGRPEVHDAFASAFVVMKVNFSADNKNEAFLGRFPASAGYPDFLVLDSDGKFVAHQATDEFETGKRYDPAKLIRFAQNYRR